MYFVYVLYSRKDHNLYIGFTGDLQERLKRHNESRVTSTKARRPLELIFYESYINKSDALRRELYFKTTAGKRAIKLMLKDTFLEM